MANGHLDLLWEESASILEFVSELDDSDFDHPSLCTDWNVRDVMGHMCSGHTLPLRSYIPYVFRYRLNVMEGSKQEAIGWAKDRKPEEIVSAWEKIVTGKIRRGASRLIPPREGFVDHLIHHQDMRRPIGMFRNIPEERLEAALGAAVELGGLLNTRGKARGLRLMATDISWSFGAGPEVRGPGESLLMALGGRPAALDDLDGEGTAELAARVA